ncbi:MAG: biopolymer transporter ExbD [Verrucomicrobiota bacterium]
MSTKRKPLPAADNDPKLDMSSMIDVSFLLLIFFLITSTLDPKETDLGMSLPTPNALPGEPTPIDEVHIAIQSDGSISWEKSILDIDNDRRDLPLLNDKLTQYKIASDLMRTQPLIIVNADDNVPSQRFIDVLNALAKVEIHNVTIADITNN